MFNIKGIVSRDLHICFLVSIESSEDPTPYGAVHLILKFSFHVKFFRFSRLSVVSLPCEWSLAIRPFAAPVVAPYWEPTTAHIQMLFWWKTLKMDTVPVRSH
jgi:hypothetical protein